MTANSAEQHHERGSVCERRRAIFPEARAEGGVRTRHAPPSVPRHRAGDPHSTHVLQVNRFLALNGSPPASSPANVARYVYNRTAQQLYYSASYKLRGVIAYPRLHADYWTPKHAHRLTVLPSPRFEQSLLVHTHTSLCVRDRIPTSHCFSRHIALIQAKYRHLPGRSVTTYLNGLVKITISLQRTGFYLGEPVRTAVDVVMHTL
jgi:hypothetical protein